jgi:hypothetical protein
VGLFLTLSSTSLPLFLKKVAQKTARRDKFPITPLGSLAKLLFLPAILNKNYNNEAGFGQRNFCTASTLRDYGNFPMRATRYFYKYLI